MIPTEEKRERLIKVARMYYEQDMNQSQIAREMGISRPLVSILLTEAKASGIVTITINDPAISNEKLAKQIKDKYGLKEVIVVSDENLSDMTKKKLAEETFAYCFKKENGNKSIGIGWGSMLGHIASYADLLEEPKRNKGKIFPLTGGISSVIRGYHTNEVVRILALKSGKEADFLYVPALFDNHIELDFIKQTEPYLSLLNKWNDMDQVLVAISNYPSYPDMGANTLYGDKLMKEHAVGRLLAHYFDEKGNIIEPEENGVLQVSIEQLKKAQVIAVCSPEVKVNALAGALKMKVVDTLILSFSLAKKIIEE